MKQVMIECTRQGGKVTGERQREWANRRGREVYHTSMLQARGRIDSMTMNTISFIEKPTRTDAFG